MSFDLSSDVLLCFYAFMLLCSCALVLLCSCCACSGGACAFLLDAADVTAPLSYCAYCARACPCASMCKSLLSCSLMSCDLHIRAMNLLSTSFLILSHALFVFLRIGLSSGRTTLVSSPCLSRGCDVASSRGVACAGESRRGAEGRGLEVRVVTFK